MPRKNHKSYSPKAYYIRSSLPLDEIEVTKLDKLNKYIKAVAPVSSFVYRQKFNGDIVRSSTAELSIPALNTGTVKLTRHHFYVVVLNTGVFELDIDEICYKYNISDPLTITLKGTAREVSLSGVARLLLLRFIKSEAQKYYAKSKN